MLIEDSVLIKIVSQNIKWYTLLGYNCKYGDIIQVKNSELPRMSKRKEKRVCDECGEIYERAHYLNIVTYGSYSKDVCPTCLFSEKYKGIRREKVKNTNLTKYGAKAPLQNKEVHEKQKQTMLKKYGAEFPSHSKLIRKKIVETNWERYGGPTPMSDPKIAEKVINTLRSKDQIPTSSQQEKIFYMLKNFYRERADLIMNFPVSSLSLDILLSYKGEKIDIEYDGWYWHQDITKDRKRDEFLKSLGYRVLRIRGGHLIPELSEMVSSIDEMVKKEKNFHELFLQDWKNKKR